MFPYYLGSLEKVIRFLIFYFTLISLPSFFAIC